MLNTILEKKLQRCQVELQTSKERIASLETENALLYLKLAKYEGQLNDFREEKYCKQKTNKCYINKINEKLSSLTEETQELRKQNILLIKDFREFLKFQQSFFVLIKRLKMKLSSIFKSWKAETESQTVLQSDLCQKEIALKEALFQMQKERTRRKILHNNLMEIRGNICVYCRVRPMLTIDFDGELQKDSTKKLFLDKIIDVVDDETVIFHQNGSVNKPKMFEYEKVFNQNENQEDVFDEISPLVTSLLDGYNVCIMAYGQTGSGKTHTMLGEWSSADQIYETDLKGIIPRAGVELFRQIEEYKKTSSEFNLQISVFEIYNNEIRDLLAPIENRSNKLTVFSTSEGSQEVSSVTTKVIKNKDDIMRYIVIGMERRKEGKTEVHSHSSRSHLIVQINVTQTRYLSSPPQRTSSKEVSNKRNVASSPRRLRKSTSVPDINLTSTSASCTSSSDINESRSSHSATTEIRSKLQLVDLAGSECVAMSGASGSTLLESSFINKSLSALADVLQSIGENKSHIPYRNSRLTHLLQDTIGGNAKLAIMLCVSPARKYRVESLHCLHFGSRARQVSRGPIKKRRSINIRQQSMQITSPVSSPSDCGRTL